MNKKKLLVCCGTFNSRSSVSTIHTAGAPFFSAQSVHAEITRTENHEVKSKITPGSENGSIYVDMTVESTCALSHVYIYADIVNAKTGQIPRKDTFNERFDRSCVPNTKQGWTNCNYVPR